MPNRRRHVFKFVVDGIDLPSAVKERLARAVAEAGLRALADLDTEGDRVAVFRARPQYQLAGNGNGTQGITVAYLPPDLKGSIGTHLDQAERGDPGHEQ